MKRLYWITMKKQRISIYLSQLSLFISIYLSISVDTVYIYLSIYLSIYIYIYIYIYVYIYISVESLSFFLSFYLSISVESVYIYLSIYLSTVYQSHLPASMADFKKSVFVFCFYLDFFLPNRVIYTFQQIAK